jgi:hypothetical protein
MKRGGGPGDSEVRPHGAGDVDLGDLHEITDSTGKMTLDLMNSQAGGRKSRRRHRHHKKSRKTRKGRKHGGGVLSTALLPFGLFGLQKYFQGSRSTKRNVKKFRK